jgi:hypothetical protein
LDGIARGIEDNEGFAGHTLFVATVDLLHARPEPGLIIGVVSTLLSYARNHSEDIAFALKDNPRAYRQLILTMKECKAHEPSVALHNYILAMQICRLFERIGWADIVEGMTEGKGLITRFEEYSMEAKNLSDVEIRCNDFGGGEISEAWLCIC